MHPTRMVTKTLSASIAWTLAWLIFPAAAGAMTCENIFEAELGNEAAIERLARAEDLLKMLPQTHERVVSALDTFSELADYAFDTRILGREKAIEVRQLELTVRNLIRTFREDSYGARNIATANPVTVFKRTVEETRTASKDREDLQPHLRTKLEDLLIALKSAANPTHLDPKWKLEKILLLHEVKHPGSYYTVRLNQAYRVLYAVEADGRTTLLSVSKTLTHAGH